MTTNATRDADRFHIPPADAVKQPVTAMSVIDLKPLFLHFERELQRERDRVAVERTTASSAREALAACEERVRQANAARDLALTELAEARDSYAELLDARDAERDRHVRAHESMTAHRDKLLADCDRHEREAAELRAKLASVAAASPAPGSTAAVIEAYRLLCGHEPHCHSSGEWLDRADGARSSGDRHIDEAKCFLLYWLDVNAQGGRP